MWTVWLLFCDEKIVYYIFFNDCWNISSSSRLCLWWASFGQRTYVLWKGALSNNVTITNLRNIICKGNAFKVAFDCKFWSECAKAGDRVNFSVPGAIYTQEGTLLIPAGSKVVGTVIRIEKQRIPNKNARVYLNFECLLLPDGSAIQMSAKPLTKDSSLKEGPWHTAGKLTAYTLGLGIVGAGAGTGFAFIPNPAKLGVGYAIGIPVGTTVGLITGLVTPGLKYHAKAGEEITIILCDDLAIKNNVSKLSVWCQ